MGDKAKSKKRKGPLRTGAIIPVLILVLLFGLYFKYFFDSHLASLMAWTGTEVNGAEVDIGSVSTSFIHGTFELKNLQVTDKSHPDQDLVEVGRIKFQFLWDALLRMKFVVNEAAITDIAVRVPRQHPGRVLKPSHNQALAKLSNAVLEQTQKQYQQNVLGDIAHVVQGTNPVAQLKNIQGQLKSDQKLKELQAELKVKQREWAQRLRQLPQAKDFQSIADRAKKLKFNSKNPLEVAQTLKEADKLYREADEKVKTFESASRDLNNDISGFDQSLKQVQQLANDDLKDLQNRLKIPNINVSDFSQSLFGQVFQSRLIEVRKYMAVAREYMPPKKKEKATPSVVPHKRSAGRFIRFPITTGYPLFWLKRAVISSTDKAGALNGRLSGELKDLTSDPVYLGRPMTLSLKGDFPQQKIYGFDALLVVDHTTALPMESLKASVASYPVGEMVLSRSPDLGLAMTKAAGQAHMDVLLKGNQLLIAVLNHFKSIHYEVDASSGTVKDLVSKVTSDIPTVDVVAKANGDWGHLRWHISSNLGKQLSQSLKKEVDAKVKLAQAKLKNLIDGQIKGRKAELQAQFAKVKGQFTGQLAKRKSDINKAKASAERQVRGAQKGKSKRLEQAGKKALDALKKRFGL